MPTLQKYDYLALDALIKRGSLREVARVLQDHTLSPNLNPRQKAEFFRRIGDYPSALNSLRAHVFEQGELKPQMSDAVLFEYALNLVQHGLPKQAHVFLLRVKKKSADWHQLQGFIALKELNYEKALIAFKNTLSASDSSQYQKLVARVNIANAYLGTFEFDSSLQESEWALALTDPNQHQFLIRYLNHMKAQAHAFLNNLTEYQACTAKVFEFLTEYEMNKKISADLFEFYRGRFVAESIFRIKHSVAAKKLLKTAEDLHEYHALNEIRVMNELSKKSFQTLKANRLNPSGRFFQARALHLRQLNKMPENSEHQVSHAFFWAEQKQVQTQSFKLSLFRSPQKLKIGQLPYRILQYFLINPWRRFTVPEIYQAVFPERTDFSPTHSPNLIHQGIKRLNAILQHEKVPMQVRHRFQRYELNSLGKFTARMDVPLLILPAFVQQCRDQFKGQPFQLVGLAKILSLSPRQVQNLIRQNRDYFEHKRTGRNLFYRLK